MKLSRRGFLAAFGAAIVGAKAIQHVVKHTPPKSPRISFATLNEAYLECSYGAKEPNMIVVSPSVYAAIVSNIEPMHRYIGGEGERRGLCFAGATIVRSPYMPDNRIWMRNTNHPYDARLNQTVELVDD